MTKCVQTIKRPQSFKRGRKYFTTQVNCIVKGFVLGYQTRYFDLRSFK